MFIDTHAHLNNPAIYDKLAKTLEESFNENVKLFIVPGYDLATSKLALDLAHQYPFVFAAIGFHPTEIKNYGDAEYNWLEEHSTDPKVVAIGECGYDFHWDTTTEDEQTSAFVKQIEIAKKCNKPLVIHCRDAIQKTYGTLKAYGASAVGGVMHAYCGSLEMTPLFIKENFLIGIGGTVTFTNAKEPKRIVENIDLKYIISETDSPYLTPHPYRGKENSPKYIPLVIEEIARLKGISSNEVMEIVMQNAKNLFKIMEDINE